MAARKRAAFESESLVYTLYPVRATQFHSVTVVNSFQSILSIASKLLDRVGVFGATGTPPRCVYKTAADHV